MYNTTLNGTGVDVYVLDTGLYAKHSEFGDRASCFLTAMPDVTCLDLDGHGTHVAGTIGGATYGVAKGATLRGIPVLGPDGSGSIFTVIAGIELVMLRKIVRLLRPAVANLSLGGGFSPGLNAAVEAAAAVGVVMVVSAGNSGTSACTQSPASSILAITVGATDRNDQVANYSNRGICCNIYAPGSGILSASIRNAEASTTFSGTSMAAPHVAGVAALYLEANPRMHPLQLRRQMRQDSVLAVQGVALGRLVQIPSL